MSHLLKDKICLVTGASKGIGKAIVERFVQEGAIVYANARSIDAVKDWATELNKTSEGSVKPIIFDITDEKAVKEAVQKIKKEQGRLDVLVNNAAISYNESIGMISSQHLREILEVNVVALTSLLQLAARVMSRQQSGSIINISSLVGICGNPGQLSYAASKGAVIALTKSAAKELAPKNIRVNSVAPGLTDTEMFRQVDQKALESRISNIGMGRLAKPVEIADTCIYLASDLSTYVSGQVISVDGNTII